MISSPAVRAYRVRASEIEPVILPCLAEKVFHVTRYSSFEAILASGHIDPNADGRFGNSFPGSSNSYGRCKGYVCLFDFRKRDQETISWGMVKCNFLHGGHLGDRLAFLFLRPEAFPALVTVSEANNDKDCQGRLLVPEVECWYPKALPLNLVAEVLDVSVRRTPIEPGSLTDLILKAHETEPRRIR